MINIYKLIPSLPNTFGKPRTSCLLRSDLASVAYLLCDIDAVALKVLLLGLIDTWLDL